MTIKVESEQLTARCSEMPTYDALTEWLDEYEAAEKSVEALRLPELSV